jgi:hypothetical protein
MPQVLSFKPVAPNVPLNLGLAVVVGLALGVSVAFLREYLNRTILSAEDVDRFLTAPALASDSMLLGENICECSAASCPRQSGESAAPAASGKPPGSSHATTNHPCLLASNDFFQSQYRHISYLPGQFHHYFLGSK